MKYSFNQEKYSNKFEPSISILSSFFGICFSFLNKVKVTNMTMLKWMHGYTRK